MVSLRIAGLRVAGLRVVGLRVAGLRVAGLRVVGPRVVGSHVARLWGVGALRVNQLPVVWRRRGDRLDRLDFLFSKEGKKYSFFFDLRRRSRRSPRLGLSTFRCIQPTLDSLFLILPL